MIPADHITIEGDTAWVVVECPPGSAPAVWEQDDKPCDVCGGIGKVAERDRFGAFSAPCPDCDGGTGRHTFDIEVEWDDQQRTPPQRLRVHVIDVLPFTDVVTHDMTTFIEYTSDPERGYWFLWERDAATGHWSTRPIMHLPPTAEPGMWVVRLQIHAPENVETST